MAPRETHRIALISDIHGNEIALREVLRSIDRLGADEIVCLGDVATLGVAPSRVIERLQRLECRCIMGNHDDYILDDRLIRSHTSLPMVIDAIDWCREQLSSDQIDFVARFEPGMDLPLGDCGQLKLYHGSPSSNMIDLLADTPSDEFDRQLGPERAAVMAGGHTHVQMVRQHRGIWVVNPGSVGAPFRESIHRGPPTILAHAEYAIVSVRGNDVGVELQRVGLDRRELAEAALASANPMRDALAAHYL